MRVISIGAGGIGGVYGGLLARAGHDVRFLARGPHLQAIRDRGLEVRSPDFGTFTVRPLASDTPHDLGQADLLLFAVKTYDLDDAARAASKLLASDGALLTFQNGVEAPDQVAAVVGDQRVLIGTTRIQATIIEPGVVGHLSPGHAVTVSELYGPATDRVEQLVATLRDATINAAVVADGHLALWEKAALLVPLATISSACRAPVGPMRELPETLALYTTLVDEIVALGEAHGFDLAIAREQSLQLIRTIVPTWTSMQRDFERGGRTELEALAGAVVRMSAERGLDAPASRTAYAVLKLRQLTEGVSAMAEQPLGAAAGGR
jgi:2-dehydropantoate 2-reductase